MLNRAFFNIQRVGILMVMFIVCFNVSFVLYKNNLNIRDTQFEIIQEENLVVSPDEAINLNENSGKTARELQVKNSKHAYGVYVVREGDNLYWLAQRYDSSIDELVKLNGLNSETIKPSQALVVPLRTLREYPVGVSLTDQEVQWIAQMIHAEARGEPYIGQVAVGAVILNRLKSRQFPNTVYDVLFQRNAFQPIRDGSFFKPASEVSYRAALEALSGHDPTNGSVFFFNPRISNDRFMHARPAVVTIGQHRFMH